MCYCALSLTIVSDAGSVIREKNQRSQHLHFINTLKSVRRFKFFIKVHET